MVQVIFPSFHHMKQEVMLLSFGFCDLILEVVEKDSQVLLLRELLREEVKSNLAI